MSVLSARRPVLGPVLMASFAVLAACTDNGYSPSLTQVRTGEVEVEDPPVIPEDVYVPGITVAPENDELDGQNQRAIPLILLDTTHFDQLEDPAALPEHATWPYSTGIGALYDEAADGELAFDDVRQGSIGDCYLAAALSSALYADVDHTMREGLVREITDANGNATSFVVRFYDAWGDPIDVEVDADLVRSNTSGKPAYLKSLDSVTGYEEWAPSIVEKGYAQWHGGFEKIGKGGYAGDVLQALTGSTASYRNISSNSETTLYNAIDKSILAHKPVVSCTYGEDDGVDYTGSGVYAYHCYSTLDVHTTDGVRYVKLRNPWGYSEPAGNGADDGIFDMKMSDYMRLYQGLHLGGGFSADHTAPGNVTTLAVAVDGTSATATWTAPGDDGAEGMATKYDLRVSTSPIDSSNFFQAAQVATADPSVPGTVESVPLTGLQEGTRYWVAVRTEDESGNVSAVSNVAIAEIGGGEPVTEGLWMDLESGTTGWQTAGLWHVTDIDAASGSHAFWYGQEETWDYATGARTTGELTSPAFRVPNGGSLAWEQVLDVESSADADQARVELATSAGGYSNWTTIWTKDGTPGNWTLAEASLSSYAGQDVKIRFVFDSVDSNENFGLGWFVDDVYVE